MNGSVRGLGLLDPFFLALGFAIAFFPQFVDCDDRLLWVLEALVYALVKLVKNRTNPDKSEPKGNDSVDQEQSFGGKAPYAQQGENLDDS